MELKMLFFFAATTFTAWILLFVGISQRRESRRRNEQEHTRTTGCIVDYVRAGFHSNKGRVATYWKPVVEYMAEGEKYRAEYENSMNREKYPVGTETEILYDVSDPCRFHLESDPVFENGGGGAIKLALLWILFCAVLTIVLAVCVGGYRFDFDYLLYRIRRFLYFRR